MGYRVGFYLLVLAVGLLAAMGLGLFDRGRHTRPQSVVVAAPNGDNGLDNSSSDNSSDNSDNSRRDNSNNVTVSKPAPAPTAAPTAKPTSAKPASPPAAAAPAPAPAAPAGAQVAAGPCQFVLGFADLHSRLNGIDGNCEANETNDAANSGDRVQQTFNPATGVHGLMAWDHITNTMRWTDGGRTLTWSSCGLQERLNTQSWLWEKDPTKVHGGQVDAGYCGLA